MPGDEINYGNDSIMVQAEDLLAMLKKDFPHGFTPSGLLAKYDVSQHSPKGREVGRAISDALTELEEKGEVTWNVKNGMKTWKLTTPTSAE